MKNLSVLAIPAKENQAANPYNYILYTSLEQQGVQVHPYSLGTFLNFRKYDLVHFHWPENYLYAPTRLAAYKAFFMFMAKMAVLKMMGKKVVWTVHNMAPHENRNPGLMRRFYRLLYRHMNGFISLNRFGAGQVVCNNGVPQGKVAVIPHPHYVGYYPNQGGKPEARQALGLPQGKFVLLFIGQVRAYKNVLGLVDAFKKMNRADCLLLIAGKLHEDVAADLEAAVNGVEGIRLFPSFVKDEELQTFFNASDLVVNTFHQILNSGSVFLNLSFAKPTLVPQTGSLQELQQQAGLAWVKTFSGKLDASQLARCIDEVRCNPPASPPDLSQFEWNKIAAETKEFYRRIVG